MPYISVSPLSNSLALTLVVSVSSLGASRLACGEEWGRLNLNCNCSRPTTSAARTVGGAWHRLESANFEIWARGERAARELAENSERELVRVRKLWPAAEGTDSWKPKCILVLHSSLAEYQHAIANPRDRSVGMATFVVRRGEISNRRIDLRSDAADWLSGALPHELTHLVLADSFRAYPLPTWIDEGLAVLSECPHKRARRKVELDSAMAGGGTIPMLELLSPNGNPRHRSLDVFYSQSASLAEFLVQHKGMPQFREFVERAQEVGCNAALRDTYQIEGASHLEQLWVRDQFAKRTRSGTADEFVIQP